MESLVIHADSRESAEGFCSALSGFDTMLVEEPNGHCEVEILPVGGEREAIEAVNAIEDHLAARGGDPAQLDLYGRRFTLRPLDAA
jgi:hypothetical protein